MKSLIKAACLILVLFLLFTCTNEIDLLSEIQKEVKIANNLFLIIESVSPADQITNVNPGNEIIIVFDRDLDLESVNSDTLQLYNDTLGNAEEFLSTRYNETTRTLNIKPTAKGYFDNLNEYIITISGFRGQDGSEMPEDYVWSFTTGLAPAGSIVAADRGGPAAQAGYTNEAVVNVSVDTANEYATRYFVSGIESDLANPGAISEGSWKQISEGFTDISIANVEGLVPVYCIFRGLISDVMTYSRVFNYEITLDKTAPVVSIADTTLYQNSLGVPTTTAVCSDANSDAGFTYLWERTSGTQALFGTSNSLTTTVYALSDTPEANNIRLSVTDAAGNIGYSNVREFVRDTVPPAPPVFSSPPYTGTEINNDTLLDWSWTVAADVNYSRVSLHHDDNSPKYITPLGTLNHSDSARVLGPHTFSVRVYDVAGNYAEAVDDFKRIPEPADGAIGVVTRPTFRWPHYALNATYDLYTGTSPIPKFMSLRKSGITDNFYTIPLKDTALLRSTTYYWRYEVKNKIGVVHSSNTFSFTTRAF